MGAEIASFDKDLLTRHFSNAKIDVHRVKTMTLAEAAQSFPDARVDLVIIDFEWHERTILESIDFVHHRVCLVMYEHKHMSDDDICTVEILLSAQSFQLKHLGRHAIVWQCPLNRKKVKAASCFRNDLTALSLRI